ncbi:acyl-CoA dehydrogenase family protein [Sphingomonas sp. PP-CE-3A-406]|uniref:acyl-CoA dehydrogenase family protein n=1 Tax=Sphingomonas sp. PP-CE-3A-406 TaxID=2135659 RepID=UPI0011C465DA|nr:acyl-CoA dehydrogenase family protein [Sphingomonas sp. PP-CE-3A-406]
MVSRLPATCPTDFNSGYPIPNSIEELLADIQALAPEIRSRADEIEIDRRVPSDLIDRLRTIGIFRMTAARGRGGLEFDLASIVEAISALGRIDGSVGWTAMIGCSSSLFLPLLPQETYDLIYRDSPDVVVAGSSQPLGTAQTVDGGWLVTGRWPFASGCQHAQWMRSSVANSVRAARLRARAALPSMASRGVGAASSRTRKTKASASASVAVDG